MDVNMIYYVLYTIGNWLIDLGFLLGGQPTIDQVFILDNDPNVDVPE